MRANRHLGLVIALLGVTFLGLALLGYRASVELEETAVSAAERRAAETLTMLETVFATDMQGVQKSVLRGVTLEEIDPGRRFDLVGVISDAFARFPYPEVFFVWNGSDGNSALFSRSSRVPAWAPTSEPTRAFPVTVTTESPVPGELAVQLVERVVAGERLAVIHTSLGGAEYQVVARTFPGEAGTAVLGFAVNLAWVRENYFRSVAREISEIGGARIAGGFTITITAPEGPVAGPALASDDGSPTTEARFALAFFDPAEMPAGELARLRLPEYVARVDRSTDRLLEGTDRFVRMTRWTIVFAVGVAGIVLIAGVAALRKNAELDAMKSEFVARASHELKTPLASIRLAAETLSEDRYDSTETVRSYGKLLLSETARLDQLVGQLLTFSRLSEADNESAHQEVDLGEAVEEALGRLRPQLAGREAQIRFTRPDELRPIRGDREALVQAFGNVIENAMKYAGTTPYIGITFSSDDGRVVVEIADRGPGIPADEVGRVFERFFRGRSAGGAGAGLGLSIVRRIIEDHGGNVAIGSAPEHGTRVRISFPEGPE